MAFLTAMGGFRWKVSG